MYIIKYSSIRGDDGDDNNSNVRKTEADCNINIPLSCAFWHVFFRMLSFMKASMWAHSRQQAGVVVGISFTVSRIHRRFFFNYLGSRLISLNSQLKGSKLDICICDTGNVGVLI